MMTAPSWRGVSWPKMVGEETRGNVGIEPGAGIDVILEAHVPGQDEKAAALSSRKSTSAEFMTASSFRDWIGLGEF